MKREPVASFDSASAMLRATARALRGKDFFGLGTAPRTARALAPLVGLLPGAWREMLYAQTGALEAVAPARVVEEVRAERLARWAARHYPRHPYPLALIGSSNGAATHLAVAMRAPWLPQTFLVPVRRDVTPGDAAQDLQWGSRWGRLLLRQDPTLQLHQLHDPNQDSLMLRHLAYFRLKLRRLPRAYASFLETFLAPGAPIVVLDCRRTWPTTRVGDRHVFQFGALGGLSEDLYDEHWPRPPVDGRSPEAEWGFEASLLPDLEELAQRTGHPLLRCSFDEPEHLSEEVASLYRWWYNRHGLAADRRLLAETFIMLEPLLCLRTGSVPFWLTFNTDPSATRLAHHLDRHEYEQIAITLFSHGAASIGLAPIERWRALAARGRREGLLAGADTGAYPRDFAVYVRFTDVLRRLPAIMPPPPLTPDEIDAFLFEQPAERPVRWQRCR